MATEAVQSFLSQLAKDPDLQSEVDKLTDEVGGVSYLRASQLRDVARRYGFDFSRDELLAQCRPATHALSPNQLEAVVGGIRGDPIGNYNFRVEIEGVDAGQVIWTSKSLLILDS